MDGNTPKTQRDETQERSSLWKRLLLPTMLTIAIGSIYARSKLAVGSGWEAISSAPVELDCRQWQPTDNQDGAVAKLGVSPYYFVSYNSPDGQEHFVPLANKKGSDTATSAKVPTIDPGKRSVRFRVLLKNHHWRTFDEKRSQTIEGIREAEGKPMRFKALIVPREGVTTDFHPSDVERVELQTSPKR